MKRRSGFGLDISAIDWKKEKNKENYDKQKKWLWPYINSDIL